MLYGAIQKISDHSQLQDELLSVDLYLDNVQVRATGWAIIQK